MSSFPICTCLLALENHCCWTICPPADPTHTARCVIRTEHLAAVEQHHQLQFLNPKKQNLFRPKPLSFQDVDGEREIFFSRSPPGRSRFLLLVNSLHLSISRETTSGSFPLVLSSCSLHLLTDCMFTAPDNSLLPLFGPALLHAAHFFSLN